MRGQASDLVYEVKYRGTDMLIYCLFEHQSTVDRWMALRLLGYMVRLWEDWRREHPGARKLPVILPVVLYQGGSKWRVSRHFADLLELPADAAADLRRYMPDFEYDLTDLSRLSPEEIRGNVLTRVTLALMKAAREDKLLEAFKRVRPLLRDLLRARATTEMAEVLMRYIKGVDAALSAQDVSALLIEHGDLELNKLNMSIEEQHKREGRVEGRVEGRQEGILDILEARFGEVPYTIREQVRAVTDDDQLRNLLRSAAVSVSIESFAAGL